MGTSHVMLLCIIALSYSFNVALAYDPSPLQDFCVADLTNTVRLNGLPCADPAKVEADDFFFSGLDLAGNTSNPMGSAFTAVAVNQMPGLNTLGIVIARLDFEPNGFLPPHFHARATEILTVLEGSMEVGFVTSSPSFRHYKKVVEKGDVFVVPVGLVHYQRNVGTGSIVAIAALNSQNPGITALPNAVFGANPDIDTAYLARAFALDHKTVQELQQIF